MNEDEYYKTLPKKRMGVGALILNKEDKVLIVKPSYRDYWSMPGGVIDKDESPRAACIREAKEEIDLDVKEAKFLGVAYRPDHENKGEALEFMFFCGKLTADEADKIKIDGEEIIDYKFATVKEAVSLLDKPLAERLEECLKVMESGAGVYLEI